MISKQSRSAQDNSTARHKGMRQGAMLMLLSVILIPAYVLLAALFPANDRLVESAVSDTPFEKISQAILLLFPALGPGAKREKSSIPRTTIDKMTAPSGSPF